MLAQVNSKTEIYTELQAMPRQHVMEKGDEMRPNILLLWKRCTHTWTTKNLLNLLKHWVIVVTKVLFKMITSI